MTDQQGDYVLGTTDTEIERLGLQHRVWREAMLGAWRRAGLKPGGRALDAGAGPGYATLDLAEAVGPEGEVVAVERSPRFAQVLREQCTRRGLRQVQLVQADLMELPAMGGFDLVWCRWVASFVADVPRFARWLAAAAHPGGTLVLHEYADYGSWQFAPPRPRLREFVAAVMSSWRATGGEPDVAGSLIAALRQSGVRIRSARPLIFVTRPGQPTWQWPASFVASNVARLVELDRVSDSWGREVLQELADAEHDPESLMLTPMLLEIVGEPEPATGNR
jgi:SAM-dependent methyltransferase